MPKRRSRRLDEAEYGTNQDLMDENKTPKKIKVSFHIHAGINIVVDFRSQLFY